MSYQTYRYSSSSGALDTTSARRRVPTDRPSDNYVAPRDVFPDYNFVMARMQGEGNHDGYGYPDNGDHYRGSGFSTAAPSNGTYPRAPSSYMVPGRSTQEYGAEDYDDDEEDDDEEDEDYGALAQSSSRAANRPSRLGGSRVPLRPITQDSKPNKNDKQCTYVDPEGLVRCTKINRSSQEAARHWRSCHLYKEAKAMLTGTLAVGQGTAITSRGQLDEVRPRIECQQCGALITRSDAMRRHLKTNCKQ